MHLVVRRRGDDLKPRSLKERLCTRHVPRRRDEADALEPRLRDHPRLLLGVSRRREKDESLFVHAEIFQKRRGRPLDTAPAHGQFHMAVLVRLPLTRRLPNAVGRREHLRASASFVQPHAAAEEDDRVAATEFQRVHERDFLALQRHTDEARRDVAGENPKEREREKDEERAEAAKRPLADTAAEDAQQCAAKAAEKEKAERTQRPADDFIDVIHRVVTPKKKRTHYTIFAALFAPCDRRGLDPAAHASV